MDTIGIYAIVALVGIFKLYLVFTRNSPPKWVSQKFQKLREDLNGSINIFSTLKGKYYGHSFEMRANSDDIDIVLHRNQGSEFKLYISSRRLNFPLFIKRLYDFQYEDGKHLFIYSNDQLKSKSLLLNKKFQKFLEFLIEGCTVNSPVRLQNLGTALEKDSVTFEISSRKISVSMKFQHQNLENKFIANLLKILLYFLINFKLIPLDNKLVEQTA